jgi:hypothetical protein
VVTVKRLRANAALPRAARSISARRRERERDDDDDDDDGGEKRTLTQRLAGAVYGFYLGRVHDVHRGEVAGLARALVAVGLHHALAQPPPVRLLLDARIALAPAPR